MSQPREVGLETPSAFSQLDQKIGKLRARQDRWARLPVARKIEYLRGLLAGTVRVASGQVEAAVQAKGLPADSPLAGEDWIAGPYITARVLRLLIGSLEQIRQHGDVWIPRQRVLDRPDGGLSLRVFPLSLFDQLLYSGFTADVWLEADVSRDNLTEHLGEFYHRKEPTGKTALVLGAGNVASIGPLDVVHKLFVEGQVVLLKLNPVNDYLGPFFEDAFSELIRDGFLATAYGGADVGGYLCHHEGIDEVHITGGAATHDAIVFGPGADGAARKARREPLLKKRITSELGNVSPVILVPGRWSRSAMRFQAQNVATQMVQNAGFNCNAAKVIITHDGWPQRDEFLEELGQALRRAPRRPAYYPGAVERYESFLAQYPEARRFGERVDGSVPPTLATGLDPETKQPAFTTESFCSFTAETALTGQDAAEFLRRAVEFCNTRLYGSLNAAIVVDPNTEKSLQEPLETAIRDLRYGTVAINQWAAMAYALGSTPWGAYPGHTLEDIQSGIGFVHNTFLIDRPIKTVVRGPFKVFPKPPWFVGHKRASQVGRGLLQLEAEPSLAKLPGIVLAAIRG